MYFQVSFCFRDFCSKFCVHFSFIKSVLHAVPIHYLVTIIKLVAEIHTYRAVYNFL